MSSRATRESFIEDWPLYAQCEIKDFYPPDNISLLCGVCKKETTWVVKARDDLYSLVGVGGYYVSYRCQLCQKSLVCLFLRKTNFQDTTRIQKIGQFPAQSIDIPSDVERRLGDDAALYKNALICRNQNFGIGALAYMRRVIENKTNELIEVVAEQAAGYEEITSDEVGKIRAAKDEKITYDQRLRLASEAIPGILKPSGANPLAALYELLSVGLHAKSDADCLSIADEIKDVFEYVFSRLRAEIEDRNAMVSKIKKWVGARKDRV